MSGREFDVVLYGATGFTGGLVAEYFARNVGNRLRWALAGRNMEKLEGVRQRLAEIDEQGLQVPLLQASADDVASLGRMASRARVVLSTVGPFIEYGLPLVEACVDHGTHYADITGEPEFVRTVWARHDERAKTQGVRVVSCCGFDSIPTDLGVWFALKHLDTSASVHAQGVMTFAGRISGGTWNSALRAFADAPKTLRNPWRVQPEGGRHVTLQTGKVHRDPDLGWIVPMPSVDGEVVARSAASLDAYGPDFNYAHYMRVGSTGALATLGAGASAAMVLAQTGPTRRMLGRLIPSGEGPPPEVRARSSFEVRVRARAADEDVEVAVRGGDPGYDETAKMASQSALCLAQDTERLPRAGGVLTTAEAMGDALLSRLVDQGIRFELLTTGRKA